MMLEARDLVSAYGRVEALHGVSFHVGAGEIVALIGANGAGKTTAMRCLSGVQPLKSGQIFFEGRSIEAVPAHRRIALGLAQSPEGRMTFKPMSVEDNLLMGGYLRKRADIAQDMEKVYALFPALKEKRKLPAGALSGGQQQMLAIGRAIMAAPKLLLLDEPSMGLAPVIVQEIFEVVRGLAKAGMTILLVEQNAFAALKMADRGYVMETGRIIMEGAGKDLLHDAKVRSAYLGH